MTAQYWTITGYDMWRLDKREVFDFRNLNTGEVVTCSSVTEVTNNNFLPVTMPKQPGKTPKAPKSTGNKSNYKGVKVVGKKFSAQLWDKKNKKHKYLGMFESELLAAAAVQEENGDKKEARRLRNEYEEGNGRPEVSEPQVASCRFPSEE